MGAMCFCILGLLTWAGAETLLWAPHHSRLCQYQGAGVGDKGDPAQEAITTSCASLYLPPWWECPL